VTTYVSGLATSATVLPTTHVTTHIEQILSECVLAAINWEDLLSPLDVQSAYNEFALRLTNIINDDVPLRPLDKGKIYL